MLPPVESAILAAYPKFQGLYRDLCTNKLNEDGSSKLDAKALKDRQGFENVRALVIFFLLINLQELYDGLLLNLQLVTYIYAMASDIHLTDTKAGLAQSTHGCDETDHCAF